MPIERHTHPVPTVDVVIRAGGGIVLVKRRDPARELPPLVFDNAQILADYLAGRC